MEERKNEAGATERYRRGKQAIFYNIIINLILALAKGFAGYLARSHAMIADAFNSSGDLLVNMWFCLV